MPTIALCTDDRRLVAHVMVAGLASLADGPVVRACTILAVPTDAALLDEPLVAAIEPWLGEEQVAQVVARPERTTVIVNLSADDQLVLELDAAMTGRWSVGSAPGVRGVCRPAG